MNPPQVCQNTENHGPFPANFCKTPSWTWLHRVMFVGVSTTAPSTYQSLDNQSFLTPLGPGSVLGSTQSSCGFCPPGARLGKAENEWGNKQEGVSGPRKSYGGNETGDVGESDGETTSDTVGRGDLGQEVFLGRASHPAGCRNVLWAELTRAEPGRDDRRWCGRSVNREKKLRQHSKNEVAARPRQVLVGQREECGCVQVGLEVNGVVKCDLNWPVLGKADSSCWAERGVRRELCYLALAATIKCHRLGGLNNRHLFLTVLDTGKILAYKWPSFLCVLTWQKALVSLPLLIRTLIPSWGLPSHDLIWI